MSKEEFIKSIRSAVENALVHEQPNMDIVQVFLLFEILDKLDGLASSLEAYRYANTKAGEG